MWTTLRTANKKGALFFCATFLGLCPSLGAWAEDIDVFAGALTGAAAEASRPNIIFVLDNTSNWAANSQQFPDEDVAFYTMGPDSPPEIETAEVMGEFELAAIASALKSVSTPGVGEVTPQFNVGVISFDSNPNSGDDGGTVRFDLQHYQEDGVQAQLDTVLRTAFVNSNSPNEKLNSNSPFGTLAYDVYNYLTGGSQSYSGSYTVGSVADDDAYASVYDLFNSPLTESSVCAETYLIWVGNPNQQGPRVDQAANSTILRNLYTAAGGTAAALSGDASGTAIPMPEFEGAQGQGGGSTESKGYSQVCYASVQDCTAAVDGNTDPMDTALGSDVLTACAAPGACSCANSAPRKTKPDGTDCGGSGRNQTRSYDIQGPVTGSTGYGKTSDTIDGLDYNLDDWTRFFYDYGVPIPGSDARTKVTTFTVDVYDAQPSEEFSSLLESAANVGGGYRIAANNFTQLTAAFEQVLADILSVNSSFSAVTLPLSAAQQGRSLNQVFIASFTPEGNRLPAWSGNLKKYKLQLDGAGGIDLVDSVGNPAINPLTGIVADCAISEWTQPSGEYFNGLQVLDAEAGSCEASAQPFNSDSPDGPHVAKGGAAQQIRALAASDGSSERNLYILGGADPTVLFSSGSGAAITSPELPGEDTSGNLLKFVKGELAGRKGGDQWSLNDGTRMQVDDPIDDSRTYFTAEAALDAKPMPATGLRATIHGDVVHSQPLTVSYDNSTVRIFYGSNDGFYRMVNAATGVEEWAFIADEHLGKLRRQYDNSPTVEYSNTSGALPADIEDARKDYFMDGVAGLYTEQNADLSISKALLFPTMRRGGNHIYALDVSPVGNPPAPPSSPTFLWKYATTGQAWGRPWVGKVNGRTTPVLVTGGGYDACLDPADSETDFTYSNLCSSPNGTELVVIDAESGADANSGGFLAEFSPSGAGPFVADVAVEDVDGDGFADFAYAVDAKGSIYRLSFGFYDSGVFVPATSSAQWRVDQVAAVSTGTSTKLRFFNRPEVNPFLDTNNNRHMYIVVGAGDRERPMEVDYPYSFGGTGVDYYMYAVLDRVFAWDHDGSAATSDSPDARPALTLPDANDGIDCEPDTILPCYGFLDISTALNNQTGIAPLGTRYDYHGWYFELPDRGEQIINPAVVEVGKVFFNSYQPGSSGYCGLLGTAKGYNVELFSPEKVNDSVFNVPALPPPPVIPPPVEVCEADGTNCKLVTPCFYCGDTDELGTDCDPNDPVCGLGLTIPVEVEKSFRVLTGPDT